mmetsp:Transcript_48734/g.139380  ORF Transcript_48734/g.139380 Transcript_48734/m.139380 type:complete len:122 (-) Transcript_48734:59-424(-)
MGSCQSEECSNRGASDSDSSHVTVCYSMGKCTLHEDTLPVERLSTLDAIEGEAYDPTKPEYVEPVKRTTRTSELLLVDQIERLEAVLAKRRDGSANTVTAHYQRVLDDMRRSAAPTGDGEC